MRFYYGEMTFEVPESIYYPREDSLLLAKQLEKMNLKGKNVLEIGCGCGFLSVLMAKAGANVTAVDINGEAVSTTKANASANGVPVTASISDLFSSVNGSFDLIVFNPPYLPADEKEQDNTYAGGTTGRETIERFIAEAANHLNPRGSILMVISSLTGEDKVIELFQKNGMHAEAACREKVPWEELIVIRANL